MTVHPIDTEALRRLSDYATPGPWEVSGSLVGIGRTKPNIGQTWGPCWRQDIEFIAAARTTIPQLLDQLDQAEARIKAVRDVHWADKARNGHICAEDGHDWPCPTIRALDT